MSLARVERAKSFNQTGNIFVPIDISHVEQVTLGEQIFFGNHAHHFFVYRSVPGSEGDYKDLSSGDPCQFDNISFTALRIGDDGGGVR